MAKPQQRLHCNTVAACISLVLLCSSAAAANLAATIGAAAATGLKGQTAAAAPSNFTASNATYSNVTANDGRSDKIQVDPKEWLKMGSELRTYLRKVFAGRPDMLQRIEDAWEKEKREVLGGSFVSYNAPSFFSNDENKVEAMSHTPGNPAINELYETGHPWAESRMEELVTGRGYPLEKYPVVTLDGYELIVYRIPYGKYRNNQPGVKKPVAFLQHGVTLASDSMTILNANESLAFILADAGFDVWMGNTRGNTYSRRNVNGLYPYQQEFWYFSIDQLALIDLPTMVDFALQKTGAKKLAYAGHSQGATLVMALCAGRPEYNDKFSVVVNMGPVIFVDFFRTPFLRFAAINSLDVLLITLGFGEFIPNRLTAPLYLSLCTSFPLDELCAAAVSFFTFGPSIFITPDDYVTIATTWPSSVGTRNFNHWAQMFRTPEIEFRQFDFGTVCNRTVWKPGHGFQPRPFFETCNQQVYGTETPPVYDLSKVTCPQVMFLAENDLLSVASDVEEEVRRLGPAHVGDFIYSDYGHMDFVWDRNSKHTVDMVDVFYRYSPGTF